MLLGNYEDIMVFQIDNENFELLGEINQLTSVIWGKNFIGYFDFQINAPITEENKEYLKKGRILWPGGKDAGIIEIVNIERNADGQRTISVKGRTLESILERRAIKKTYNFKNEKISTILYQLVGENFVNPTDQQRIFPYFECAEDEQFGQEITMQKTGGNVLEALKDICGRTEYIGFEVQFVPTDKKIIFKVLQSYDRSINQSENDIVVFSDETEDIISDSYYENCQGYKNIAYVTGESTEQGRVQVIEGDGASEGFERYELYVDARDLQKETAGEGGTALTDEEYEEVLKSRGAEKLGGSQLVQTFEGEMRVANNPQFTYGIDYNLGDKVTVLDVEAGISANATVSTIQETISSNYEAQLVFGYELPGLFDKVKNLLK